MHSNTDPAITVTFLDVGQGDSTVVALPDHGGILIDCPGGSGVTVVDRLEYSAITTLNLVVISHSDIDHAGGVVDVVKSFSGTTLKIAALIDRTLKADAQENKKFRLLLRDLAQLMRDGTEYQPAYAGEAIEYGELSVSIVHPSPADHLDSLSRNQVNDCSVVVRLEYAGSRVLLPGDIESQGWRWMFDRDTDVRADVLKFPHHGAWDRGNPTLDDVIKAVDPTVVVVSVGSTNSYGHPAGEVLAALKGRQQRTRLLCTQATARCHRGLQEVSVTARELVSAESRGGHAFRRLDACPCAGHVTVRLSAAEVTVSPTANEHERVIDLFDDPQCR